MPLTGLVAAEGFSIVGNMVTMLAVPWFVLETTGSASLTGITGFVTSLPIVISGPLGGVLVDRVGYRTMSIVSDLASGATVALVPILYLTSALQFWHLLVLMFLGAILDIPGQTARSALVPDLAALGGTSLERATSILGGINGGARVIGAPLAGGLIAALGAAEALFVNAGTFLISAAIVWYAIPRPPATANPTEATPQPGYLSDLRTGFQYVWTDRLLRTVIGLVMVTNFLDYATFAVVLPVYATDILGGAVALGVLVGALATGSVIGAFAYGALSDHLPRTPTLVTAFIVGGVVRYVTLALNAPLSILIATFFTAGVFYGPVNPILRVIQYERIPQAMRGRALGLSWALTWGAMPLGALLGGFLIDLTGLTTTLITIGTAYLIASLTPLWHPQWRTPTTTAPEHNES